MNSEMLIAPVDSKNEIERAIRNIMIIRDAARELFYQTGEDVYRQIQEYCEEERIQIERMKMEPPGSRPSICLRIEQNLIYLEEVFDKKYTNKINKIVSDKLVNVYQDNVEHLTKSY